MAPTVKSAAPQSPQNPKPKGTVREATFSANGEKYTALVNIDNYSTRVIREHNKGARERDKMEDADEADDLAADAAIHLALIGTVECDAFEELTYDCLMESHFDKTTGFVRGVQELVFPPSPTPPAEA